MSLFELTDVALEDELRSRSNLGEPPTDPHDLLLWNAFLASPDWPGRGQTYQQARCHGHSLQALVCELRALGRATPLKHREFLALLMKGELQRQLRALAVLQVAAQEQDQDAIAALLRAAVEAPREELSQAALEALLRLSPRLTELPLAALYTQDPWLSRFHRVRETLLPELELPPLSKPRRRPVASPVSAAASPPKRRWQTSRLDGPGILVLSAGWGRGHRVYQVTSQGLTGSDGFRYSTYRPPSGNYYGSGDSRHIRRCLLASDLSQLLLCLQGEEAELIDLHHSPTLVGTLPAHPWTSWSGLQDSRCAVGSEEGLYLAEAGLALRQLHPHPVVACALVDGQAWSRLGKALWCQSHEVADLPHSIRAVFSPDGRWLASLVTDPLRLQIHEVGRPELRGEIPLLCKDAPFGFSQGSDQIFCSGEQSGAEFWSPDGQWLGREEARTLLGQPEAEPRQFEERSVAELAGADRFFGDLRGR